MVDFGAGIGFWTIPLAKIVGRNGKVYALSANDDFFNFLEKKISYLGLNNVEVVRFSLEEGNIPVKEKADLVVLANVLHVIRNREEALKRAKKLLNKNGRVLVVDYLRIRTLFGPPIEYRMSEEEVIILAEKVGLRFKCTVDVAKNHYGLIFENQ